MAKKKLTIKEKKFVAAKVQGKTNVEAYKLADYAPMKKESMNAVASKIKNKPHIQQAIDDALVKHGASPEWAVLQLMKVAEQDKEIGAKRLASKDILELHGWNKADRPTLQLDIKNAFFGNARNTNADETRFIEAE